MTAEKGYRVLLKDKDLAGVARGQGYIKENLQVRDLVFNTHISYRVDCIACAFVCVCVSLSLSLCHLNGQGSLGRAWRAGRGYIKENLQVGKAGVLVLYV